MGGEGSTFTITFSPTSVGNKTAAISIENTDFDENPYIFTINGNGILSEINVKQGTEDFPSGIGYYDFETVLVSTSSPAITFKIENLGTDELNLTDSPIIQINGQDDQFSITQPTYTNIAPSTDTTFDITFTTTSAGDKTATVSIANDDSNENPYTFTITGDGLQAVSGTEIFSTSGTYYWTPTAENVTAKIILIAGGGGGGGGNLYYGGGGGGAGELFIRNNYILTTGETYTIVVGNGSIGGIFT